eukprot:TRINITY_DN745_c0_g2_i1.p1 TRINITY_DN745_c0_g2~~TRINITY_DN745_c0_g2_i1.p1  ORF type:complete len:334 (-),score=51.52 TRINITY_DN745_c0_g2_i1:132-1133(-)
MCYDAMESGSPNDHLNAGQEALKLDPQCVIAFNLLAWAHFQLNHKKEALANYNKAIDTAEKLNPKLRKAKELQWAVLENRPYMRALHGRVLMLIELKNYVNALRDGQRLLRLNPDDNQGIRWLVAKLLVLTRDFDGLASVVSRYTGNSDTIMCYFRSLLAYHDLKNGRSTITECKKALRLALLSNPHVPKFLLYTHEWPSDDEGSKTVPVGSKIEALEYANHNRECWISVPGSLTWLAEMRLARLPSREIFIADLKKSTLLVVFKKVENDEVREMACTKNLSQVPKFERPKEGQERRENEDLITVFSEGCGWRSFYYSRVYELPFYEILHSDL